MKAFFTHIAEGTLTEDILMSFIVAGCDMDAVNNSLKTTPLIYAYKKKKYDMVIGSRFVEGAVVENMPWLRRVILLGSRLVTYVFNGIRVTDVPT